MFSISKRAFTRLALTAALGLSSSLIAGTGVQAEEIAKVPEVADLLPQSVKDAGVLRVAMPDTGRPLAYKDGDELKGMDPALANALAAVLGLKPQLELIPFASALTGLQANKFDVSYGEFYVTAKRLEVADFVTNWEDFSSFLVVAAKDFKPAAITDICEHIVGAMAGSAELEILSSQSKNCGDKAPTVSAFPSVNTAVLALNSGRVDAVLIGRGAAEDSIMLDSSLAASGEIGGGPTATAVARNENSGKMLTAIQAAYNHLIKSGDYMKILDANGTAYGAAKSAEIYTKDSTPPKYGF
ncbi:MAG: transporter substrate-binding domain-containing protein [Hyphomicrobiales bacterium]|nr:transporter substrate-binding domain-containing protein [Hyphomicrobiales bacterium]